MVSRIGKEEEESALCLSDTHTINYSVSVSSHRKEYLRNYQREYRKDLQHRIIGRKTDAKYRLNRKIKVLTHYSGGSLQCANPFGLHKEPFTDVDCLTIDHLNGGGTRQKDRLKAYGNTFYRWLITNNYPEGYRVLCANCQAKRHWKVGEHEIMNPLAETFIGMSLK